MSDYIIRKIELNELNACAEIIRESFSTVAKTFNLTEENCPSNGAFIKAERLILEMSKGNIMYGLFYNSSLIGFVELEDKGAGRFELEKLAVLPTYRHQGYGTILLDYAIKTVNEMRGETITIGIIEQNTILKSWYLKHGFAHTGTKEFPHLPFLVGFMELRPMI